MPKNLIYLPSEKDLPVNKLAACFNNTVATYKYYWFLSVVQAVESGQKRVSKKDLFARMISNSWYTVNYFHISFGKQDKLQQAIEFLKINENLEIDSGKEKIYNNLIKTTRNLSLHQLFHFNNQVPHWFLSPWFPRKSRTEIYRASQHFNNRCLYALYEDRIELNPEWTHYLTENSKVLKDFCFWNLAIFLQIRNPNIPDIPNKLIRPGVRNNLIRPRKFFWDLVIKELGSVECIYTGKKLFPDKYDVEHFIPYSFVSHDLIWNLIPADKSFNCSKSDKLPPLNKYFTPFYNLQKTAIEIIQAKSPKNKYLEDYLTIFPNISDINKLSGNFTRDRFKERIQPLIIIASNNGFEFME
jgi:hypothetical protein